MSMELEPPTVHAAEGALLHTARAVVAQLGSVRSSPISPGLAAPKQIGPTAARLLQETLSRGAILALARGGGWRRGEWLDGRGGVKTGRLWERHAPPALTFSAATVDTLNWLVGSGAEARPKLVSRGKAPLERGDELVLALAGDLVAGTPLGEQFFSQGLVRRSGLAWLMHPLSLALSDGSACQPAVLASWTEPDAAPIIEALTPTLAVRHQTLFLAGPRFGEPAVVVSIGETTRNILEALSASPTRPDLASFFVDAGVATLDRLAVDAELTPPLSPRTSLGERSRAFEAAGSWLRGLLRLRRRLDAARGTSYIDDDYVVSQFLLRRWEHLSVERIQKTEALLGRLTQLDSAVIT